MDPNATLKELRQIAAHVLLTSDTIDNYTDRLVLHDLSEEAENMATLLQALDEWISGGGFLPKEWRQISGRASTRVERPLVDSDPPLPLSDYIGPWTLLLGFLAGVACGFILCNNWMQAQ